MPYRLLLTRREQRKQSREIAGELRKLADMLMSRKVDAVGLLMERGATRDPLRSSYGFQYFTPEPIAKFTLEIQMHRPKQKRIRK